MNMFDFGVQEKLAFLDLLFEQPRCDDQLVFRRKAAQALDRSPSHFRELLRRIERIQVAQAKALNLYST